MSADREGKSRLAGAIDRFERAVAPHTGLISIGAMVWFWLGVAIQARFIDLPELPRSLETVLFWVGVGMNAVWWGLLRPAIEKRRKLRSDS